MYTLGINFSHHSSIALLKDNELVLFTLEERLNRYKHWGGGPKMGAPLNILSLVKNYTNQIDFVCGISGRKEDFQQAVDFLIADGVNVKRHELRNANHHLYHAAASFYMSHFDSATSLVIDGAGSIGKFKDDIRASETTSIYNVSFPDSFECIYKYFTVGIYDCDKKYINNRKVPITITDDEIKHFLTLKRNDGPPFSSIGKVDVSTNLDIGVIYTVTSQSLGFINGGEGKTMGLSGYGNKKHSNSKETTAYHVQKELEAVFLKRAAMCDHTNLVLGGGCALNILGNSLIKKTYPDKNIYIDPIATDGTNALGAAAHTFYTMTKCKDKLKFDMYTGPSYTIQKEQVYECARKYSL
jgi:predicted NodU family carbamoyl transferase